MPSCDAKSLSWASLRLPRPSAPLFAGACSVSCSVTKVPSPSSDGLKIPAGWVTIMAATGDTPDCAMWYCDIDNTQSCTKVSTLVFKVCDNLTSRDDELSKSSPQNCGKDQAKNEGFGVAQTV